MSKRPHSPPPHISSTSYSSLPSPRSSSSSSSQLNRLWPSVQLLQGLPASLLSAVCSFLSVHAVVSLLRRTCHALHCSVTADCLLQRHLAIRGYSLQLLAASNSATRALLSRVQSLTIRYRNDRTERSPRQLMWPLQQLRSAADDSRFLFSSLSSLHIVFERDRAGEPFPKPSRQACLQDVMQLLQAQPQSFCSLRSLHIDDSDKRSANDVEMAFTTLARLPQLSDCRINVRDLSALSRLSLLSTLQSMPALTCIDVSYTAHTCAPLLQLLCAEAATPLLTRLTSLLLPADNRLDNIWNAGCTATIHDAFLCRLSALRAPPALQLFSAVPGVEHRAAGLLSVFSLPQLKQLDLRGYVRCSDLFAFASSSTAAPCPLVSLTLPMLRNEPADGGRLQAPAHDEIVDACNAMRRLLSRFTTLRQLACNPVLACASVAVPGRKPDEGATGCSSWLYCLSMKEHPLAPRFPFAAPLSFPLLTQLDLDLPVTDLELELTLSACPQLLKLNCRPQSWTVVLLAAQHCRCLLELTAVLNSTQPQQPLALAAAESGISPFLPQLLRLSLWDTPQGLADFLVLRHFIAPPHAELRRVDLQGRGLTAPDVLSLACLPRLSYLCATHGEPATAMPGVEQARERALQRLLGTGTTRCAVIDAYRPITSVERRDRSRDEPPLGPHQQQEMRQRVLHGAAAGRRDEHNALASVEGVEAEELRAAFFVELRSVLTAAAEW